MSELKILFVASEVAPFARTGGLGDVLGSLPKALARRGHAVKVCLPNYATIETGNSHLLPTGWETKITVGAREYRAAAQRWRDSRNKMDYYFIDNADLFKRGELYRDPDSGGDYVDNDARFVFFNRAVLGLAAYLEWKPDIIHVHDWQSALIPAYLKTPGVGDALFDSVPSLLTIHNLGYQGVFEGDRFELLDLPDEYNYAVTGPFEFFGKINFLKAGIVLADAVSTVSPTYANEIRTGAEFGCGLEGVLAGRSDGVTGILNGADYSVWSPSRDKKIPYRYTISNLSGKRMCRVELLNTAGLPVRERTPVIGMISRLADQKGWDLFAEAAKQLLAMDLQVIILGTGEEKYHKLLSNLEREYPDKLRVFLTFDDTLAHQIEAGSDMFLMASRYEPCGLNQIYSLKYGTVPIVRSVGGLADSVTDYDPETQEGTGFVFVDYSPSAMIESVERAMDVFRVKRKWTRLMKAGMKADFSWGSAAEKYEELYHRLIGA
ncbi:MAG: glycogen synthase GlgA [Candidatus Zixiibacteriota bacterium]|nr:MAG: glycogen synthase GlgA [candidate division Zixibacteria bacterium]